MPAPTSVLWVRDQPGMRPRDRRVRPPVLAALAGIYASRIVAGDDCITRLTPKPIGATDRIATKSSLGVHAIAPGLQGNQLSALNLT
jgi:hypothetical protein